MRENIDLHGVPRIMIGVSAEARPMANCRYVPDARAACPPETGATVNRDAIRRLYS
jgi:hypothetical protein